MFARNAKFQIGQVVRHRVYPFRGVIFDVDPTFSNTEEWYRSIPQDVRPSKDQPFYHLLAENAETEYIAYVSEQNLVPDASDEPLRHPQVSELFEDLKNGVPYGVVGAGAAGFFCAVVLPAGAPAPPAEGVCCASFFCCASWALAASSC